MIREKLEYIDRLTNDIVRIFILSTATSAMNEV